MDTTMQQVSDLEIHIQQLVNSLSNGLGKQKTQAAQTLSTLALNKANHSAFSRAQAIPPLIVLIKGTDEQMYHAVVALGNLMIDNQENFNEIVEAGALVD